MKKIEDLEFGRAYVYYSPDDNAICITTWFKDFIIDETYDTYRGRIMESVYASPDLKLKKTVIIR